MDVHGAIAGLAAAVEVRSAVVVEHQVPHHHGAAVAVDGSQDDMFHVVEQALLQVTTVVPGADAGLTEDELLLGSLLANIVELGLRAPVVVIGCTHHELRAGKAFAEGGVDVDGVIGLTVHIVVVVVVVEDVDLGLQPGLLEGTRHALHQRGFLFPGHVGGGAVAVVQGFVLRAHSIDGDALLLHGFDKADKVLGVGLAIVGIQMAVGPAVVGFHARQVVHLHPFRTGPGGGNHLHLRVDAQDLLQNRYHVVGLVALQGEVGNALLVAEGVFSAREVVAANRHPDVAGPVAVGVGESLAQEGLAGGGLHVEQIVAGGVGDGIAEAVDALA